MHRVPTLVDLYLLPLEGCDIVLGAITWDFSKWQMQFMVGSKVVKLQGLRNDQIRVVDGDQFNKGCKRRRKDFC